jgi:hypothetical protein
MPKNAINALVATMLVSFVALASEAGQKTYTFTNNTGSTARDLHIVWSESAVTFTLPAYDPPAVPWREGVGSGSGVADFHNGEVSNGGAFTLQFTTTGSGPTINQGWWTDGNGNNIGNLNSLNTDPYP